MQADRKEFIQKAINEGLFLKVEKRAKYPHVYVTSAFYALNIDDKNGFINVVWAYHIAEDAIADKVVLFDGQTGKKIGAYAEVYGGLKLD